MNHEKMILLMNQTIQYARKTNPIWPFASMLTDETGRPLCLATDCAHISPLFHSESLAIHAFINSAKKHKRRNLILFSTAEPDSLSQSAIYWARITHDLEISEIVYGSSLQTIAKLWEFGIDISAEEIAKRAKHCHINFSKSVCEKECDALFSEAKAKQQGKHPSQGILSDDSKDFYLLFELESLTSSAS